MHIKIKYETGSEILVIEARECLEIQDSSSPYLLLARFFHRLDCLGGINKN